MVAQRFKNAVLKLIKEFKELKKTTTIKQQQGNKTIHNSF